LIPRVGDYFQYQGSLTTPPCTENVYWTVMQKPITFSKGQIKAFSTLFPKNNRNEQKAFNRLIRRYNNPGN
jgi:carbonic anhydrase